MSIIDELRRFVPISVEQFEDDETAHNYRAVVEDQREYVVDFGVMDAQEILRELGYEHRVQERTFYVEDDDVYRGFVTFYASDVSLDDE